MNTTLQTNRDDLGKLILRVTLATLMLFHGGSKLIHGIDGISGMIAGIGLPSAVAYLVYVGEVLAPLLLLIGVLTRPAAAVVAINMVVAMGLAHSSQFMSLTENGGWALELQGFFFATAMALAVMGAGRFSIGGKDGKWN